MPRYVLHQLEIDSVLLRGNPLGDPARRQLHVLAPEGLKGPLPAVWVLAGYSGNPAHVLLYDPWYEGLPQRVQRLSDEGRLPPALFVVPDCFTGLGGAQYLDSPAIGPWERHLWEELLPALERRFEVSAHGVVGKSSGGYGAIVQGMRHPDIVRAVVCHSGDSAFEYCYLPHFPALAEALRTHGSLEALLEAFASAPNKRGKLFDAIQTVAMAACYSPDANAPAGIALPFDPETLELRPEVWTRWLALDPVRMVDHEPYARALAGMKLLMIDCGAQDEFNLHWGARQLAKRLAAKNVAFVHEEFEGGHSGTEWRMDVSLPRVVKALGA